MIANTLRGVIALALADDSLDRLAELGLIVRVAGDRPLYLLTDKGRRYGAALCAGDDAGAQQILERER